MGPTQLGYLSETSKNASDAAALVFETFVDVVEYTFEHHNLVSRQ